MDRLPHPHAAYAAYLHDAIIHIDTGAAHMQSGWPWSSSLWGRQSSQRNAKKCAVGREVLLTPSTVGRREVLLTPSTPRYWGYPRYCTSLRPTAHLPPILRRCDHRWWKQQWWHPPPSPKTRRQVWLVQGHMSFDCRQALRKLLVVRGWLFGPDAQKTCMHVCACLPCEYCRIRLMLV